MATDDFFRSRLFQMIDLRHPLVVLASRMPWSQLETVLPPACARQSREGTVIEGDDLFGPTVQMAGSGTSSAGRPRLPIRLMAALLYLKHAFNLSDEELVARWSENVVWQYFSGLDHYTPKLPCDATQIGRFRSAIGEAGVEELLKATIDTAVQTKAVRPSEFERVIVDSTVQEKAIAHPVDSRYKLYALHAPEFECISKGKARKRYEFGVKSSIVVTHKSGLVVGARTFPGNPYDGQVLSAQLEHTRILLEDTGKSPRQVFVDLGYRGVDRENPNVEIIHRGKDRSLTRLQRRYRRHRPAVEPTIGHLKADHRMDRCWLEGQLGDALHAVLCATGFKLRWLWRAMLVATSANEASAGCASRIRRFSGLLNEFCKAD
jgi:IS5 family transposase